MEEENSLTNALHETALTRRGFLKWSALVGAAAMAGGLSSCAPKMAPVSEGEGEETKTVICYHNCGGRCTLWATVKDGTVTRIQSEPTTEDPINNPRIIPCVRGRDQTRRVYAANRLQYPLKRVGKRGEGKFERVTWDEALDLIAAAMKRIKEKYGSESFYFNYATGAQYTGPESRPATRRLLRCFGGYTDYYGDYSAACYYAANSAMFGTTSPPSVYSDDMLYSKLIVLFGYNPMVTRSGGDNAGYFLLRAKQAGAKVIVVDPIYHDKAIATQADWVPIFPGTDVALITAMAYVMVKENLYDKEFMAKYSVGFDEDTLPATAPTNSSFLAYIDGRLDGVEKTPEWAAEITGLPASRIASLAREIAGTKPCCLLQGWGWQRRAFGEQPVRALPILAMMTGNFGLRGGGPGLKNSGMSFKMAGMPLPENPVKGVISVYMWPDFITRGKEMTSGSRDKIRGVEKLNANLKFLWNGAGNCLINQHSDINGTAKMLQDESLVEFIVSSEVTMSPSAKFADIVLPDCTSFEMDTVMNGNSDKGNHAWAVFSHKLIEPLYESRESYIMLDQLAERLGIQEAFREGHASKEDWLKDMVKSSQEAYPDFPSFEEFREKGIYRTFSDKPMIPMAGFMEDPVANPLGTPSGKIEIYSETLANWNESDVIPPIPKYIPEWEGVSDPLREKYPLLMVGHHSIQRSHSTFDNADFLREVHKQAFWINPRDAAVRGIKNGDPVRVYNDRGEVHVPAFVTTRLRPGVASLPQGAWYTPDENGIDTRGCVNVLTKYEPTPLAKGNPQHTNLVQVEKL